VTGAKSINESASPTLYAYLLIPEDILLSWWV
jgi:hypothetical protein